MQFGHQAISSHGISRKADGQHVKYEVSKSSRNSPQSRIKLKQLAPAMNTDTSESHRALGSTKRTVVRLQHIPATTLQLSPANVSKLSRILPPLGVSPLSAYEKGGTLQKLIGSGTARSRAASAITAKRSGLHLVAFAPPSAVSNRSEASSSGDRYDQAAAELLQPDHVVHSTFSGHATPLERCRSYVNAQVDWPAEENPLDSTRKRQFCLPQQAQESAVWSRPILVYGDGAGAGTAAGDFADSLSFDSKFESGNLLSVHRTGVAEYEMLLQPDHATTGHTQWYMFAVSNMVAENAYRFHIINLNKPDSLYGVGQLPLFFSSYSFKQERKGWQRMGRDIKYIRNGRKRNGRPLFTLSFTLEFPHEHDRCLLAHCFPYTYTDQQRDLQVQAKLAGSRFRFDRDELCRTLAGNVCQVLTITAGGMAEEVAKRKGVFISARVHPGESNSSLIMKGILDFLTGSAPEAELLRSSYVFKIIPMLNPDGVVNGHYRCNLEGYDLNRHWHWPSIQTHPTIFCAKELLRELAAERGVDMFVDIHGHSVKHNLFAYGVPGSGDQRAFVQGLQAVSPHFSWRDSKFTLERSKEQTGRGVAWRELGIEKSYTLEASLCGVGDGKSTRQHFAARDFELMGAAFGVALAEHCAREAGGAGHEASDLSRRSSFRQMLTELSEDVQPGATLSTARLDATSGCERLTDLQRDQSVPVPTPTDERAEEWEDGQEDGEDKGGESSSEDEDRIAEVEETVVDKAETKQVDTIPSLAIQEQPSTTSVAVEQVPQTTLEAVDQDRNSASEKQGSGWSEERGYSCIPFPPTADGPGGADGRHWQRATPRRLKPATARTPRDRRRQSKPASEEPTCAQAEALELLAHSDLGAGGVNRARAEDAGWSSAPRSTARAGAGPAAPRPPVLGTPRHVTSQGYPAHPAAPPPSQAVPPPAHGLPPPSRPSFYPFPAQRRLRLGTARESVGLALSRAETADVYSGPPGRMVGGRWQQSAKPVGPGSKFLPLMLGAVPAMYGGS